MKNRKITTTIAASALALTSVIGLGAAAFAADSEGSTTQSKAPTAAQIAEHQAQRQEKLEEKLTSAVKDGKITEAQKTAILNFFEENKPSHDADATKEERKAARDAFKEKVEAFAEANNIDTDVLKPQGGPGGPGGRGGKEGRTPPTKEERTAKLTERLDAAVTAGTITEAQKDSVLNFVSSQAEPNKDATQEERKAEHEARKAAFESFAEDNGIPTDLLKPPAGKGGPSGQGGPQGRGGPQGQGTQSSSTAK